MSAQLSLKENKTGLKYKMIIGKKKLAKRIFIPLKHSKTLFLSFNVVTNQFAYMNNEIKKT